MKLINQKAELWQQGPTQDDMWDHIAKCTRVCYQSTPKNKEETGEDFCKRTILLNKHYGMLEHGTVYLIIPYELETFTRGYKYRDNPYSRVFHIYGKYYITTNYRVILENGWEDDFDYWSEPTEFHEKRYTLSLISSIGIGRELCRHRHFSFCLSGDSIITSFRGFKKWTIKQLYDWQSDPTRKGRIKLINVRSVDESLKTVIPNKIKKIFKTGIKDVYKVTTLSGRTIKTTKDHRYFTPNGYLTLENLKEGDYIYANGRELLDNEEWLREMYLQKNMTRTQVAKLIGCCESLVYKSFKKFNIHKPLSDRPNRHPGYGKKGMFSKETIEKIRKRQTGKNNKGWKDVKKESGARSYARNKYKKDYCEICGSNQNLEQHHWDKNPCNYSENNVATLCTHCHKLVHNPGTLGVFSDKIVSIEYVGKEEVYDIEMQDTHNFVANGLVVHNCQESTRFCKYDKGDMEFILPYWANLNTGYYEWDGEGSFVGDGFISDSLISSGNEELFLWHLSECEDNYKTLLERGLKAQEAREVLPLALKSQLIMTGFESDWKDFLDKRLKETTGKVHPDMKELAELISKELPCKQS